MNQFKPNRIWGRYWERNKPPYEGVATSHSRVTLAHCSNQGSAMKRHCLQVGTYIYDDRHYMIESLSRPKRKYFISRNRKLIKLSYFIESKLTIWSERPKTQYDTMHLWFEAPGSGATQTWRNGRAVLTRSGQYRCLPSPVGCHLWREGTTRSRYSTFQRGSGFPEPIFSSKVHFHFVRDLLSIFWQFNRKLGDSLIKV